MNNKEKLIHDIQDLLNSYENIAMTSINPDLLAFMDETTLLSIIESLLIQKENNTKNTDVEWLEKFKKPIN